MIGSSKGPFQELCCFTLLRGLLSLSIVSCDTSLVPVMSAHQNHLRAKVLYVNSVSINLTLKRKITGLGSLSYEFLGPTPRILILSLGGAQELGLTSCRDVKLSAHKSHVKEPGCEP